MKKMITRRNFLKAAGVSAAALGLAACGGSSSSTASSAASSTAASASASASGASGKVYYLNFKPEQDQAWQDLAAAYTKETGVPVTVVTAASGQYETTLMSEMEKSEAPTLFQVNGPVGLANWKDYCYDLSGSKLYGELTSDSFALKDGDAVTSIAYVIETYGIIYNKELLTAAGYTQDDIKGFDDLKKVADDIQARKAELGVDGAFTSAGMDGSSDWRFKTHLANLPLYYEFEKDKVTTEPATIKGTYLPEYKNVFDMYLKDSTTDPTQLSSKTGDDANSEFALGEAAFYQNGTWAWSDLQKAGMKADDVSMLPIYFGVDDKNEGLVTGSENYWCINSKASDADQKATAAFLKWVITSKTGISTVSDKMGLTTPFKSFDSVKITNPLTQAAVDDQKSGKTQVAWDFAFMPSEQWKNDFGNALLEYAQGTGKWDAVKTAFVDGWAKEYSAAHEG
ncbi:MAG: ABC transporter substrate-binding protein [Faecalibacterium prausnitzii]|nr:ABC transporter substrate-binding protein [Faecalibacterium prausnitzii]